MKKFTWLLLGCFCISSNVYASDEYTRCLDLNYKTDQGLAKCANDEVNRIMVELDKRYSVVAQHKYFRPWNNASHSFNDLKSAWIKYRDDYCNVLGYSVNQDNGTQGLISEARCRLSETFRFRDAVEDLVKNYQKTLKPKS